MLVSTGSRPGRTHRDRGIPCQDAFAVHRSEDGLAAVGAVADGLGSRPLSHLGSQAAAAAAVQSLGANKNWGPLGMHRAFRAARRAIRGVAKEQGLEPDQLATTLQVVGLSPKRLVAGMVGDGAIVAHGPEVRLVLAPEELEYANSVVPITASEWADHLRYASVPDATHALLFTDGLTRLLLTRTKRLWEPYQPFFDSFLPRLSAERFQADVVPRFLESETVDQAWDDDKCLVVMGIGDEPR